MGSIPRDAMRQLLFKGILHLCEARRGVTWFFPRSQGSQAAGEASAANFGKVQIYLKHMKVNGKDYLIIP
jgi:hypothetical protein